MKAMLKTAGVDLSGFPQPKQTGTGSFQKNKRDVESAPSGPSLKHTGGLHGTSLPSGADTPLETRSGSTLQSVNLPKC